MDRGDIIFGKKDKKELLDAQAHIWNHIFYFHKSMALKCAIQLEIPDAINKHGKPITLKELANSLTIHPNKTPFLSRLMRILVHSNFFSKKKLINGSEDTFDLTINSTLLVRDHPLTLAPFALGVLNRPLRSEPSKHFSEWFRNDDESPFHTAHNGMSFWEYGNIVPEFNEYFVASMASDSNFVATILRNSDEFKDIFDGLESLVDVGGGAGIMAKAIAQAYPTLECIVLDLPHVLDGLQQSDHLRNLVYVHGDMFEAIPPAQAALLKGVIHNWGDDRCIKLLKRCKAAIPRKDRGGKLIIIDSVIEAQDGNASYENVQLLFDINMMSICTGGQERCEEEWKQLFIKAGFNDYKIIPLLGPRSVIEAYHT